MPNLRAVGEEAEDRAADYLLAAGFTLITRRYTIRGGEIDLIALDGETLVFVEVRHRDGKGMTPEESVGHKKTVSLARTAEAYMLESGEKREIRFDLIAIDPDGIRHHRDFFRPGL